PVRVRTHNGATLPAPPVGRRRAPQPGGGGSALRDTHVEARRGPGGPAGAAGWVGYQFSCTLLRRPREVPPPLAAFPASPLVRPSPAPDRSVVTPPRRQGVARQGSGVAGAGRLGLAGNSPVCRAVP